MESSNSVGGANTFIAFFQHIYFRFLAAPRPSHYIYVEKSCIGLGGKFRFTQINEKYNESLHVLLQQSIKPPRKSLSLLDSSSGR